MKKLFFNSSSFLMKSKCNFEISWSFFNVFFVFSSSNSCSNNLILSFLINLLPTFLFSLIFVFILIIFLSDFLFSDTFFSDSWISVLFSSLDIFFTISISLFLLFFIILPFVLTISLVKLLLDALILFSIGINYSWLSFEFKISLLLSNSITQLFKISESSGFEI